MGHFYPNNLNKVFFKLLYAKGWISVRSAADRAIQLKQGMCAAEGVYHDPEMVEQGMETILYTQIDLGNIEPILESDEDRVLYQKWRSHEIEWDDPAPDAFNKAMNLQYRFAPGIRKLYPNIQAYSYIES